MMAYSGSRCNMSPPRVEVMNQRVSLSLYLLLLCILPLFAGTLVHAQPSPAPAQDEFNSILASLRSHGLTSYASILQAEVTAGGFSLPSSGTIFAPSNAALNDQLLSATPNINNLFLYHIASQTYPSQILTTLKDGAQLPTLLPGQHLVVTNNNPSSYFIDGQEVILADVCNLSTVACHAVNGVFNSTIWGQRALAQVGTPSPSPIAGSPNLAPLALVPAPAPVVGISPYGSPQNSPIGSPNGLPSAPGPSNAGGLVPAGAPGSPGTPGGPGGPPAATPGGNVSGAVKLCRIPKFFSLGVAGMLAMVMSTTFF